MAIKTRATLGIKENKKGNELKLNTDDNHCSEWD